MNETITVTRKCDYCLSPATMKVVVSGNRSCENCGESCDDFIYMCDSHSKGDPSAIPLDADYADYGYDPNTNAILAPEAACAELARESINNGVVDLDSFEIPVFFMLFTACPEVEQTCNKISVEELEVELPERSATRVARLGAACDALLRTYGNPADACVFDMKRCRKMPTSGSGA